MSKIKLPHASGNSMSIAAPATNPASDLELKLPATIGTAGQVLKNSDTAGTLEFGDQITQWDSAWVPTTSGNEHIMTGIPSAATHVRLIGEGMKIVDNADMRFQMGYGNSTSSSWDSDGYRISRGYVGYDINRTSGDDTDSIYTYGLGDADYTRFTIIDWYKLNTSNLWSFRATVHYYNNESSGSVGSTMYWIMGDVSLGGAFYKVKAYNNTFSAGSFKLQAWS